MLCLALVSLPFVLPSSDASVVVYYSTPAANCTYNRRFRKHLGANPVQHLVIERMILPRNSNKANLCGKREQFTDLVSQRS